MFTDEHSLVRHGHCGLDAAQKSEAKLSMEGWNSVNRNGTHRSNENRFAEGFASVRDTIDF